MKESICNLVLVDRLIGIPEVFPNVDLMKVFGEIHKNVEKNKCFNLTPLALQNHRSLLINYLIQRFVGRWKKYSASSQRYPSFL